jgi:hypothetical protein
MAVTRLSGGLTPANGSDPRTFPAIWNATADDIEQLQSDLSGLEIDDLADVVIVTPADGQVLTYDDGDWVNQALTSAQLPAGSVIAVKSAIFTGTQSASVASGDNVAVTDLSITHEVADASNKLIISAFLGAASNSDNNAGVALAIHDGTGLIAIGDASGTKTPVTAGGLVTTNNVVVVASPSVTFVHTPGSGSKTYTVRAILVNNDTETVFINRSPQDADEFSPRAVSSLVIQEVSV